MARKCGYVGQRTSGPIVCNTNMAAESDPRDGFLYRSSVILFLCIVGPWWRFDGAPTAEEWSALGSMLGGAGTIIAAIAAILALRIAAQQLKHLIGSNNMVASTNREASRPIVVVRLVPKRLETEDYRSAFIQRFTIVIENVGRSSAVNVKMPATPMPTNEAMSPALRGLLAGTTTIPNLAPGERIVHLLDQTRGESRTFARDQLETAFTVEATYTDAQGYEWGEKYPLAVSVIENALISADPLQRISRDLQAINSTTKKQVDAVQQLDAELRSPAARRVPLAGHRNRR